MFIQYRWRIPALEAVVLLSLCFPVQGGASEDKKVYLSTTVSELSRNPKHFRDRPVRLRLYFAGTGKLYFPYRTKFCQEMYVNFTAWEHGTKLWEAKERREVFALLYVDRKNKEGVALLERLQMFEPIEVVATVAADCQAMPWLEVEALKRIKEIPHTQAKLRHIELGAAQLEKREYALAADSFEAALKSGLPSSSEAWVYRYLGQARMNNRQFQQARDAFTAAIERDPQHMDTWLLLARVELRLNHIEAGLKAAETVVANLPASPAARAEYGLALGQKGQFHQAFRELDKALKLSGKFPIPRGLRNRGQLHVLRAQAAQKEGDLKTYRAELEAAAKDMEEAIVRTPLDAELRLELGHINMMLERYDRAAFEYDSYLDHLKDRPEGYFFKAEAMWANKQQVEAISLQQKALEVDGTYLPAYLGLSRMYERQQKIEEAQETLKRGVKINPEAETLYTEMVLLGRRHDDWDFVMLGVRGLARAAPENPQTHILLGDVYYDKPDREVEKASQHYARALELAPQLTVAHARLGRVFARHLAKYQEAIRHLELACKAGEKDFEIQTNLGIAWRHLGGGSAALKHFRAAHEIEPESVVGIFNLAWTLCYQGSEPARVRQLINLGLKTARQAEKAGGPLTSIMQAAFAFSLIRQGEYQAARLALEEARRVLRGDMEVELLYGQALLRLGRYEGAVRALEAAATLAAPTAEKSVIAQNTRATALRDAQSARQMKVAATTK